MSDQRAGVDYIGVGICAVCHDGQGRVFLNLRSQNCRDEWGHWDNCGGQVEFGETPEECVVREIREEYGCAVIKCQKGGVVSMIRTDCGQKTHWLILTYLVQIDAARAINGEPHKFTQVGWFTLDNLPTNRHSYFDSDVATVTAAWTDFYGESPGLRSSMDTTAAS